MTSAFGRQRGAIGPTRRPRWMARPSFWGVTTWERRIERAWSALTWSGSGRRDISTTLRYEIQTLVRSLTLLTSEGCCISDIVRRPTILPTRALRGRVIRPFALFSSVQIV